MTSVLEEFGCRLFLEMPPGHVLSELAKEAFPEVKSLAVAEAHSGTRCTSSLDIHSNN